MEKICQEGNPQKDGKFNCIEEDQRRNNVRRIPNSLMHTIEKKKEELDPKVNFTMKGNLIVKETDSLNPSNCFTNGNDLLVKDQDIKPAKDETGSQFIMEYSNKKRIIEEEIYKLY
jgi:hypothetical protein